MVNDLTCLDSVDIVAGRGSRKILRGNNPASAGRRRSSRLVIARPLGSKRIFPARLKTKRLGTPAIPSLFVFPKESREYDQRIVSDPHYHCCSIKDLFAAGFQKRRKQFVGHLTFIIQHLSFSAYHLLTYHLLTYHLLISDIYHLTLINYRRRRGAAC